MAQTETSTADAVNHLVDKIGDGLAQITTAISSHAPQAWALVVQGNYAEAAANLLIGAALFGLTLVALSSFALFVRAAFRQGALKDCNEPLIGFYVGCSTVSCLLGLGLSIATLSYLTDSHAWAMVLSPDGMTARDLLMRAL